MIAAYTPLILMVLGVFAVMYSFWHVPNMKLIPLVLGCLLFVWGYSIDGAQPPIPVPPNPGPGPEPGPSPGPTPPAPAGFAAEIKQAWKQDAGTKEHAANLSVMADIMAGMIRKDKARIKDASDIGAVWELIRGAIYPPMRQWCPYTNEALAAELEQRNQNIGPIADADREKYAALWEEFSKALHE